MADFPPNVEDSRFWLTSSNTFDDVIPPQLTALQSRVTSSDDLAHRLTALTILKQRRGLGFPRFRPPVPIGHLNSQYCYCTGLGHGSGVYLPGTDVYRPYPFPNPVQLQGQVGGGGGGGFQEPRARALRRPQNQAQVRNQNRNFQYQGTGIAPNGGSERVSSGTGVFHPRVLDSSTTTTTTTTTVSSEGKKKPGSRSKQETKGMTKGIQQRNSTNKCIGMGEEHHHQLLPDVVLPPEWTY